MQKVDMIVDLQYGSTGKGLIAGYLAKRNQYDTIVTANMPNAGHTFIDKDGNKFIHKVLGNGVVGPAVRRSMIGPGAIFSVAQLEKELDHLKSIGHLKFRVFIHENAVILRDEHKRQETELVKSIGSTGQGSAAAMVEKIFRNTGAGSPIVVKQHELEKTEEYEHLMSLHDGVVHIVSPTVWRNIITHSGSVLAEGAQGFSLGINEKFYPYCTSRDCTPARFLADMQLPHNCLRKVIGTARTFPIRVAGSSGDCYSDQEEISWSQLGVEAELTTVTKKIRRVFTFSQDQITDAIVACQPDEIFLNFCNYTEDWEEILNGINCTLNTLKPGASVAYTGHGPAEQDVISWDKE